VLNIYFLFYFFCNNLLGSVAETASEKNKMQHEGVWGSKSGLSGTEYSRVLQILKISLKKCNEKRLERCQ